MLSWPFYIRKSFTNMSTGSFVYIIVIEFSGKTFSTSSKTHVQFMKTFKFMRGVKI